MNYIDFIQVDGFPLSTSVLDFLQQNQQYLQNIANGFGSLNSVGDAIAIYGCVNNGVSISDGVLYVYTPDGKELIPFIGGTLKTYYSINETINQKQFFDGECRDTLYTRVCGLTTGTTVYLVDQIQNFKTNLVLESEITALNSTVTGTPTVENNLPLGVIVMWSNYNQIGTTPVVPSGWSLCNGLNGTPNLSGKFIVGYHASDIDYDDIHTTGGTKEVKLTLAESGITHTHTVTVDSVNRNDTSNLETTGDNGIYTSSNPNWLSGEVAEAHENRPPYYVLAYIMKTSYI